MLKHTTSVTVASLALLTLTSCGGSERSDAPSTVEAPRYTVIKETDRVVELLLEGATAEIATAAIWDWIDKGVGDREVFTIQVVRDREAGAVVCRGEYYISKHHQEFYSGKFVDNKGVWPRTLIDCPDPAGP
ncbi:hypothetical protein [Streptomyces vilmorinianum]|uniref:hypothetical protein n=1 Tax=Streptomyces vilmorinianum TaxID=3051092 RepID=UPI0010FB4D90|nr:hypothetical protein [Streptomyces vilmorinianum]